MYEIVFEFEKSEKYPISEIFEKIDYSNHLSSKNLIDDAFFEVQNEKVEKYISQIKNYFDNNKIKYEYKIIKILPKYLKENIDEINFKIIFQFKFEKDIKDKTFIKKYQNTDFKLIKENIPGLKKIIENLNPNKIFIKKV